MDTARHCASIADRLVLLNEMAMYDETTRALTFPQAGQPDPGASELTARLNRLTREPCPEAAQLPVWSFDIDLTLVMPEDEPGAGGTIPVQRLTSLQRNAVVGICSDREPSNQRYNMADMGFNPDFCIPKEMLHTLPSLLPDAAIIHVGDDPRRDRDVAAACSVPHRWPAEAFNCAPQADHNRKI